MDPARVQDVDALFVRDGQSVVPTSLARGPWSPEALHGGAVAALLAGAVDLPGRIPVRTVFDLPGPVPNRPLLLEVSERAGGERVRRQEVTLSAGGNVVARAQCLGVRQTAHEVPDHDRGMPDPFAPVQAPDLSVPRPEVSEVIGWKGFDGWAISARQLPPPASIQGASCRYVNLIVPVIAGEPVSPLSRAAAAAYYASSDICTALAYDSWSYLNAELTLHLARMPEASWIGLVSAALGEPDGGGVSLASLFDPRGRLGHCGQGLVVETRSGRG